MSDSKDACRTSGGDEGACLSPWQLAKRIAVESACASAEGRGFSDDGVVAQWLETEIG